MATAPASNDSPTDASLAHRTWTRFGPTDAADADAYPFNPAVVSARVHGLMFAFVLFMAATGIAHTHQTIMPPGTAVWHFDPTQSLAQAVELVRAVNLEYAPFVTYVPALDD